MSQEQKQLIDVDGLKLYHQELMKNLPTGEITVSPVQFQNDILLRIEDGELYIICPKGRLKDTDNVDLFRYVNRRTSKDEFAHRKRYKGWIKPIMKTKKLVLQADTYMPDPLKYDKWKIVLQLAGTRRSIGDYEISRYLTIAMPGASNTNIDLSFQNRCALVISRDGVDLTEKMKFKFVPDYNGGNYVTIKGDKIDIPSHVYPALWQ